MTQRVWIYLRGLVAKSQRGGRKYSFWAGFEDFGDDGELLPKKLVTGTMESVTCLPLIFGLSEPKRTPAVSARNQVAAINKRGA